MRHTRASLILFAVLTLAGCGNAHDPLPPPVNGSISRQNNEGYSLLYKLMSDESQVGGLFILKSAPGPIEDTIKAIGTACQTAKKQMDTFSAADNRIEFDVPDLPYMELRSRTLQADADEKALLFSSGQDFQVHLIFTQLEALDYAVQLCKAIGEKETDPTRKAFLQALENQCSGFHDQLMKLLAVNA